MIDLRSDTVTKPTEAMRRAMANAPVGDDVFGEDPTVTALEQKTAALLGKEAAVYMPSGSMTNQVAVRTHTEPGDEIILEANAHVYYFEAGAPAALSGVMCRLIQGTRGVYTADDLRGVLHPTNVHYPVTKLVCIENTHNLGGGTIWPMGQMTEVVKVAREAGLKIHLDGARLWNASVATGIPERDYAALADSVSVCFSKGLGAPVGSVLAGSQAFIQRARRFRKQFGGGMRQAGIIAAAALYALENHHDRLVDDHANAKLFAEGIAGLPGIDIDPATVQTNMVFFRVTSMPAQELSDKMKQAGVLALPRGDRIRAVFHLEISREDTQAAIKAMQGILGEP